MYVDTAQDLQRKFLHTYTMYGDRLVYWTGFEDRPPTQDQPYNHVIAGFTCEAHPKSTASVIFEHKQLRLVHIDAGWYNVDHTKDGNYCAAYLVMKRGARQNYKGVGPANYTVAPALRKTTWWASRYAGGNKYEGFGFDNMIQFLQPKYPTLDGALDMLVRAKAVALDRHFALMVSPLKEYNALLLSKYGFVAGLKGHTFYVRHEGNFQEILDMVSRHDWGYQVRFEAFEMPAGKTISKPEPITVAVDEANTGGDIFFDDDSEEEPD